MPWVHLQFSTLCLVILLPSLANLPYEGTFLLAYLISLPYSKVT